MALINRWQSATSLPLVAPVCLISPKDRPLLLFRHQVEEQEPRAVSIAASKGDTQEGNGFQKQCHGPEGGQSAEIATRIGTLLPQIIQLEGDQQLIQRVPTVEPAIEDVPNDAAKADPSVEGKREYSKCQSDQGELYLPATFLSPAQFGNLIDAMLPQFLESTNFCQCKLSDLVRDLLVPHFEKENHHHHRFQKDESESYEFCDRISNFSEDLIRKLCVLLDGVGLRFQGEDE
mmetsp:Transcript_11339/g.31620  ORF Transcript_11339/g.31620 Transcript_11339/m.31620 type:complete len:233 (-) Transcript_11339:235-933(-)|eukprot:CAMPEP_0194484244 /NCGR_PEP_ID=MMETSP0253-20130528/5607_1 /TAXON_ID=2966 /ORGANISM="Noctiluca scintillans" /LENGTH=232 /DNA_ID=CAMNT_0039324013 /DNA_START=1 /DNA_END=699 /DNA_ORIENTATION=+